MISPVKCSWCSIVRTSANTFEPCEKAQEAEEGLRHVWEDPAISFAQPTLTYTLMSFVKTVEPLLVAARSQLLMHPITHNIEIDLQRASMLARLEHAIADARNLSE